MYRFTGRSFSLSVSGVNQRGHPQYTKPELGGHGAEPDLVVGSLTEAVRDDGSKWTYF